MRFLKRLLQCLFVWGRPAPRGNPADAQLVVVQAASALENGEASETNIALANMAQKHYERFGTPISPQLEVGLILQERGVPTVGTTKAYSDISILSAEYGTGSRAVAEIHAELCRQRGWTKVLAIAYQPHIWRVIWIYEKLGLEVMVPGGLPVFCPQGNMKQRRHRWVVTSYLFEWFARLWFLFNGYI